MQGIRTDNNKETGRLFKNLNTQEKNQKRQPIGNEKEDMISVRFQKAKKSALKTILDQFASDRKVADGLREMREENKALQADNSQAAGELAVLEERRKQLQEDYGIADDSQEQKDLELLIKERNEGGLPTNDMTNLTDYQKQSMEIYGYGGVYRQQIESNNRKIMLNNYAIEATTRAIASSQAMEKAEITKEIIMDGASKEKIGLLYQETIDHIKEESEKKAEEAKETKEKKLEQEEKLKEAKAKNEELEGNTGKNPELTEALVKGQQETGELKRSIRDIMEQLRLLEEDTKGIIVDAQK